MKIILNFILFILSYSPILCISDDKNFGTNEEGLKDFRERLRVSIFSLNFGAYKYYFFTFKIKDNKLDFNMKYRIRLHDFYTFTDEKIDRLTNIQEEYLKNNLEIEEDKEFLLYQIESQNNRNGISYNKVNTYTTIILALIPLILVFYKVEMFIKANVMIKLLTVILFYIIANICVLLLQVNKVSGHKRQRYSDFKRVNKKKGIVMAYYLDYQSIKTSTDRIVTFVKNIETYIRGAVICTGILVIGSYLSILNNQYKQISEPQTIYQIDFNKLENKDKDTIEVINTINKKIPDVDVAKVLVIYNSDEILKDESFKAIINYFNIFKSKNDVVLLKDSDDGERNKIKIIMVED